MTIAGPKVEKMTEKAVAENPINRISRRKSTQYIRRGRPD